MNLLPRKSLNFPLLIIAFCCFIACSEESVVGNEDKPESIGSWTKLNKGVALPGWEDLYCFKMGDTIFSIFQDGGIYSFAFSDLETSKEVNFPVNGGNTGTEFVAIANDNKAYIINSLDNKLYSFGQKQWTAESELPFYYEGYGGYIQGLLHSNSIFLVSSGLNFSYNLETKEWSSGTKMPSYWEDENHMNTVVYGGCSLNGTLLNDKAYIIKSEGDIFEYDPSTDNWQHIAKYPGTILDRIVCFSSENKLYFGLTHIDHSPSYQEKWLENELWSFDLLTQEWTEQEKNPFELEYGKLFYFYENDRLNIGHAPLTKYYHLYRYEP